MFLALTQIIQFFIERHQSPNIISEPIVNDTFRIHGE